MTEHTLTLTQDQRNQLIEALRTHPDPNVELLAKCIIETTPEVRFHIYADDYPDLSWVDADEDEFHARGPTYKSRPSCKNCGYPLRHEDGDWVHDMNNPCPLAKPVPMRWEEYKTSYGDPENWISFIATAEHRCGSCKSWVLGDSIGGLDFYLDDEYEAIPQEGYYTVEQLHAKPWGDYVLESIDYLIPKNSRSRVACDT